jgi:hypothetical protein
MRTIDILLDTFQNQKESDYSFMGSYQGWDKVPGQERIWLHKETGWRVEYLFEREGDEDLVGVMYNIYDPEKSFFVGDLESRKNHVRQFMESKLDALMVGSR